MDESRKYREMLADGNPAELFEVKARPLWKKPRGPKNASPRTMRPGPRPGSWRRLRPVTRYFKDTDKVMDVESPACPLHGQPAGLREGRRTTGSGSPPEKESELRPWRPSIGAKSNGMFRSTCRRPTPKKPRWPRWANTSSTAAAARRISPAICHGQDGKRIRLQELGN